MAEYPLVVRVMMFVYVMLGILYGNFHDQVTARQRPSGTRNFFSQFHRVTLEEGKKMGRRGVLYVVVHP